MNTTTVIMYPREATISAACCAIIFCVVGVIGNFVTVLALIRCPKLRAHATTAFVLSLCISDLIFCALNLPLTAVRYVLISCHQYYIQLYSKISIWIQLLCIWGVAFLLMASSDDELPPLLGIWGQLGLNPSTFLCTILKKHGKSPKKVIFLIGFVLPCVVIILAYSCIYYSVRKSRKKLKSHQPIKDKGAAQRKRRQSANKTNGPDFLCFLLCFLPLMLVNVFDDNDIKYPVFMSLASILAWASSVINPFIYAASNRQYRSAYSKLLRIVKSSVAFSDSKHASNNSRQDKNGSVAYKPSEGKRDIGYSNTP
ncbi:hypothetical protein NQ317_018699 [Molorchus minor]|uniref:G-protein coupled receptors family 1 profile domain-containing protein n=1 Tax=Molorchus minor TaxID=1323400 RepID=A0ABQ9JT74_9CUCU|nr:hypothetical protein NQ317_018699 [Molorchus minor]